MGTALAVGWDVVDSEGEKVGAIDQVGPNYVIVQKGLIFVRDVYVPLTAVTSVDVEGEAVSLAVRAADVDQAGWDVPPPYERPALTGLAAGNLMEPDLASFRAVAPQFENEPVR